MAGTPPMPSRRSPYWTFGRIPAKLTGIVSPINLTCRTARPALNALGPRSFGATYMMYEATSFECSRIAQDLQIRKVQVESVVQLFNEGNTVPFITRYRKERTGGPDEEAIPQIQTRLNFLKQLNDRKQTILRSIDNQGKLTEEVRREILSAPTVRRLEDLYQI